jgi:hypothetical protein
MSLHQAHDQDDDQHHDEQADQAHANEEMRSVATCSDVALRATAPVIVGSDVKPDPENVL